jgi:hypothetical protein
MKQTLKFLRIYGPPLALVVSGALILIAQLQQTNWIGQIWPVFIMLAGFPLVLIAWQTEEANRIRLIFPGLIILGTGLMLQYQLLTEHWHSWTYAWTLYAVFFGLGLIYQGRKLDVKADTRTGRLMVVGGGAAFALLWVLFETVIFSGTYQGIMSYLLSGLLIGSGVVWGLNRFRVARIMQEKQVIHAQPPEAEQIEKDPIQARRERIRGRNPQPEDAQVKDVSPRALPAAEQKQEPDPVADAEEIITEYRPPKQIEVDGGEPSTDIDDDLQAKIDAALKDD